jgi:uncharacterized membrane protein
MYSFGIPGYVVWIMHILIGIFLAYIGYALLNDKKIAQPFIIGLMVVGVMVVLYHSHLFYYYVFNKQNIQQLPN